VSTRGAITLYKACQSLAFLEGRDFVTPDDAKRLAGPVLAHRVAVKGVLREGQRERAKQVIRQILAKTAVPG
jgi:MoxR-like ATPase